MAKFFGQGMAALGDKLGPINWQFMGTKKFDPVDFGGFLKMLPKEIDKVPVRHAIEVRNATFCLARNSTTTSRAKLQAVAIVYAKDEDFPEIDQHTADFTYARLMATSEEAKTSIDAKVAGKHWRRPRPRPGRSAATSSPISFPAPRCATPLRRRR